MKYGYLYEYYKDRNFAPTFAHFKDTDELSDYAAMRKNIFTEKLLLPPRVFNNCNVLEFGPDTGENALVFAQWGANMHLVEPNANVHEQITAYFHHFSLNDKLSGLYVGDVESFKSDISYEMIIAEGFIYTIQPESKWLEPLSKLTSKDGFVITSYYEKHGGFLELCLKALVSSYIRMTGEDPIAAAHSLFQAKWDSIPHTRTFESWANDVLFNPFVRLNYFIDAQDLLKSALENDFSLYSSWPIYRQPIKPYWHKKSLAPQDILDLDCTHLKRSQLSFLLGDMAYMSGELAEVERNNFLIAKALASIDDAIDPKENIQALKTCASYLSELAQIIDKETILVETTNKRQDMKNLLTCLQDILTTAAGDNPQILAQKCAQERLFIDAWGMPTHYAVLCKK